MNKVIYHFVAYIFFSGACMAQESSTPVNYSVEGQLKVSRNAPDIIASLNISDAIMSKESEFPSQLIPAFRSDLADSQGVEPTSLVMSELVTHSNLADNSSESPDDETIVVNGPRLPKPSSEPEDSETRLLRVRREITRLEIAYYVLSAVDAVATISCVSRNVCRELNPIMGSRPSALRVIGIKALMGLFQYRQMRKLSRRDPYKARTALRVSVGLQAAITGMTLSASF